MANKIRINWKKVWEETGGCINAYCYNNGYSLMLCSHEIKNIQREITKQIRKQKSP